TSKSEAPTRTTPRNMSPAPSSGVTQKTTRAMGERGSEAVGSKKSCVYIPYRSAPKSSCGSPVRASSQRMSSVAAKRYATSARHHGAKRTVKCQKMGEPIEGFREKSGRGGVLFNSASERQAPAHFTRTPRAPLAPERRVLFVRDHGSPSL